MTTCRLITRQTFGELLLPHFLTGPQELIAVLRENRITQTLTHAGAWLRRKIRSHTPHSPEELS